MGAVTTTVWSTVRLVGFHNWPDAHEARAYLRDRHRHEFVFTVHVKVGHEDRDVEFHDLRDLIADWWAIDGPERGAASCERMARELADHLTGQHGLTVTRVEVSEDGYDGATLEFGTPAGH